MRVEGESKDAFSVVGTPKIQISLALTSQPTLGKLFKYRYLGQAYFATCT